MGRRDDPGRGPADGAGRPDAHRAAAPPRRRGTHLLVRHRPLAGDRPRPRGRRVLLLRCARPDQCVHRRVSVPEPRPRAARRRRALLGVRPRLQRADREGRAQASVARRLEPLLADAARADRAQRVLHPDRAVDRPPLRRAGRERGPRGRALARALPDRDPARNLRDRRRDPQHLRPLLRPGALPGLLEPGDRGRARARRAAHEQHQHPALHLRIRDPDRHVHPGAPADALAPRPRPWRGTPSRRDRLARPGGQEDVQADASGHARPRADQHQRADRRLLRLALHQPRPRADGDPEGVPDLHAPAGDVLGRDRNRPLSPHGAARRPRRHRWVPRLRLARHPPDHVPALPGRGLQHRARDAGRPDPLPTRRLGTRPDARHGRVPGGIQHRPRLQRRDADAEPGLLQPAVELDPDRGRPREPVPECAARLPLLSAGSVGHPALDGARERRRDGRARLSAAQGDGRHRRQAHGGERRPHRARGGGRRRGLVRRLEAARRGARPQPVHHAARQPRARAHPRDRRLRRVMPPAPRPRARPGARLQASSGLPRSSASTAAAACSIRSMWEPETTTNDAPISRRCAR